MFAVIVVVRVEDASPCGLVLSRHRTKEMAHQALDKIQKAIGADSPTTVFQVLPVPKGAGKFPLIPLDKEMV